MRATLLITLALACVSYARPERAAACLCGGEPGIWNSTPMNGAVDVPLNRAVVLVGAFRTDGLWVVDSHGKRAAVSMVEMRARLGACAGRRVEVIPARGWAPNTRYTVRVISYDPAPDFGSDSDNGVVEVSFTTGHSLLPDPVLSAPNADVSVMVTGGRSSCGEGPVSLCIRAGDAEALEFTALYDDKYVSEVRVVLDPVRANDVKEYRLADRVPRCVELRHTSATGRRSEPLRLCGEQLRQEPVTANRGTCGTSPPQSGKH